MAPIAFCRKPIRSPTSAERQITAPPIESEWPFRYFVVECTTTSAPSSSGRCSTGDAKVLSTTTMISRSRTRSLHAAMSVIVIIGFVGVSRYSILVLGRSAARTCSSSDVSTYVNSSPYFSRTWWNRRNVPPYMFSAATT